MVGLCMQAAIIYGSISDAPAAYFACEIPPRGDLSLKTKLIEFRKKMKIDCAKDNEGEAL
jgi:phosphoribosylcarboxyaminoimidazole (NCAIR) mutase